MHITLSLFILSALLFTLAVVICRHERLLEGSMFPIGFIFCLMTFAFVWVLPTIVATLMAIAWSK